MKVYLISHTPNPEKIIAAAAKNCYSEANVDELLNELDEKKTQSFLHMLTEIGHASPIEHASFTFAIEGASRSLLAQITRHRIASFSVQSQRYVKENHFAFVTPPEIQGNNEALEVFQNAMKSDVDAYQRLTDILFEKHYKQLFAQGIPEKSARSSAQKSAIEDARYVLPNAAATKIVMTMNARSLYNFFETRGCNRAQWEIRELAFEIYKLCIKAAPTLFANAGPSCLFCTCKEGKMSCGKMDQVRDKYQKAKGEQ